MEQSETAAVARQLDFAASCKASEITNDNGQGKPILPEHPQVQLQSKLLALSRSRQFHAIYRLPQQMVAQTKMPPWGPKGKSPPRELDSTGGKNKLLPIVLPRAHPMKPVSLPKSTLKTLQYSDCFASGIYCDGCSCIGCHNKIEYEANRKASIEAIPGRNPNAFMPKIAIAYQSAWSLRC